MVVKTFKPVLYRPHGDTSHFGYNLSDNITHRYGFFEPSLNPCYISVDTPFNLFMWFCTYLAPISGDLVPLNTNIARSSQQNPKINSSGSNSNLQYVEMELPKSPHTVPLAFFFRLFPTVTSPSVLKQS